jgi:hypothetical protein
MVGGKRAFEGKSQLSVMTAILEKEPEPMAGATPALEHVVQTCLAKDPAERWQTAGEVARELRWATQSSTAALAPVAPGAAAGRAIWRQWVVWALVALAAACGAAAAFYIGLGSKPAGVLRAYIPPPEKINFAFNSDIAGPAVIAPDGSAIAFVADDTEGKHQLWVRELSAKSARPLAGTEGATFPFWSPDSHMLGFFSDAKMKTIDVTGGAAASICDAPQGRGGAWSREGIIVFSPSFSTALYKVAAAGGTPVQVTKIDATKHDSHRWPVFLPDGRHFLFLAVTHTMLNALTDGIYLGSLDGRQPQLVMPSLDNVVFGGGQLLFLRGDQLLAQEFDAARAARSRSPMTCRTIPQPGTGRLTFPKIALWCTAPGAALSLFSHGLTVRARCWAPPASPRSACSTCAFLPRATRWSQKRAPTFGSTISPAT